MRDNFTDRPVTMASLRKSVYPSPIWRAHLSNGEMLRLSFNCPGGISTEEMLARARFQASDFIRWIGAPLPWDLRATPAQEALLRDQGYGVRQPEKPLPRDLRIIRLYVEDRRCPGEPFMIANAEDLDPWQDHTAFKRPRTTVKQVKAVLAEVVKLVNGTAHTPAARATLEQAEQLLAA